VVTDQVVQYVSSYGKRYESFIYCRSIRHTNHAVLKRGPSFWIPWYDFFMKFIYFQNCFYKGEAVTVCTGNLSS
jgi:hypothetical protein